jgi:hypothetical protein
MTVLFNDGFECPPNTAPVTFTAWTSKVGNPSIVNSPVHSGSYAASIPVNNYVLINFADTNPAFIRYYVRWTANPADGQEFRSSIGWNGGTDLAYVGITSVAGTIKWFIQTRNPAFAYINTVFNTSTPTINTWYCVEEKWIPNTLNGHVLYIDGELIGSTTATTRNAVLNRFTAYPHGTGGSTAVYDDVVIADSYIGPMQVSTPTLLPAGGTYTATQNIVMSDTQATASIYYTNDGSVPDATKTLYAGAVPVLTSKTLKAIAIEAGYLDSAIASEVYVINLPSTSGVIPSGPDWRIRRKKELIGLVRDYLVMKGAR